MGLRKERGAKKGSIRKDRDSGLVYQMYSNQASSETKTDYSRQSVQPVVKTQQSTQHSAQEYEYEQNSLRVKHLTEELARKTNDIERLRNYVTQLEEGEKGLIQELARQLTLKDHEIGRLASLYGNKEEENRKVASAFEAHILSQKEHAQRIKDLLVRKEADNTAQIERLGKELERKEAQIQSLRQGLLKSSRNTNFVLQDTSVYTKQVGDLHKQIGEKENEIKKLEKTLFEEQRTNKSIQSKLMERLSEASKQTEQLKLFLIDNERIIKHMQSEFEKADGSASIGMQGDGLQASSLSSKKIETLSRELEERYRHSKRLEKAHAEDQKLNKSVHSRLREQISTMSGSIEELKSMLIEKEKLTQNLETAFEKRLAAKEDELRQLKNTFSKKHETGIYLDVDRLNSEVRVKEETTKLMAQDIAKLTEQTAMLRKRLGERQRISVESERAYEELIARLRDEHDSRVKALVQTAAQKETTLASALEEERSKLRQEKVLLKEKESQIEEALQTFAATSQQLLKLGSQSGLTEEGAEESSALKEQLEEGRKQLEEREKYAAQKEAELRNLLASIETRIAELNEKEVGVETREKLLLKEQEALTMELEVLSNAGIEISKSKRYLQEELEKVRGIGKPQKMAETAVEEAPFEEASEPPRYEEMEEIRAGPVKVTIKREEAPTTAAQKAKKEPMQAQTKTAAQQRTIIGKPQPRPSILSQEGQQVLPAKQLPGAEQELFSAIGGYSEIDEIRSIAEVGLQHGDSLEQIKESLLATGYSKQNVDKVLNGIKK